MSRSGRLKHANPERRRSVVKAFSQFEKAQEGKTLTSNPALRPSAPEGDPLISAQRAMAVEDRLDSWKEIASYFGREVRTVQRWEKRECLPVHRHFHYKAGSVYAFKTEIDKWQKDRSSGPGAIGSPRTKPSQVWSETLLPVQVNYQLSTQRGANNSSSQGRNGKLIHAIIFVTSELQALPRELPAVHLAKLLTVGVSTRTRGKRAAGFAAVSAAGTRE
jgi:hypothetical protein